MLPIMFFFKDFISFLERGEGREKERERNISEGNIDQSVASCTPTAGDLARHPGMFS